MPRLRASLIAGVVVIGAASIAADSASAAQPVSIRYTCAFPAGADRVGVQLTATAPTGPTIGPVGLQVMTRLPRAALAPNSGPVRAVAVLTVTEESGTAKPVTTTWPTSAPGSVPAMPAAGDWPLTTSGTIAATAAPRPGVVTFTAGRLGLVLHFVKGATVRATCVPAGAAAQFATQTVTAPVPSGKAGPAGKPGRPAKAKFPPGCGHIKSTGTGVPTCGYLTGYSDVAKLIGAALLQPRKPAKPGLINVDFAERHAFKQGNLIAFSTGQLFYRGHHELPPVKTTFLAFRFVPVSATLHLTEIGLASVVSVSGLLPPFPITVTATTKVAIRVSGVRVNGVPLAVGPGCRTRSPTTLVVVAHGENTIPPKGYTVPDGGVLSGMVTIPPFIDCGVTENLDPLFTGSISGRGNFVNLTQGKLCAPSQPQNFVCPPPVPKPHR